MTGSVAFQLRLSVRVHGKEPITGLSEPQSLNVGPIVVQVKQRWPYLIFLAGEFESESAAEGFLPSLRRGLYNVALEHNISFNSVFLRRDIASTDDPVAAANNLAKSFGSPISEALEPVHGLSDEEGYVIFRSGKNIRFLAFGDVTLRISTSWPSVAESLVLGFAARKGNEELEETKVATALELYLASFYETSIRARFLTLITCLEVLAPTVARSHTVSSLLSDFVSQTEEAGRCAADDEIRTELESLARELKYRREISIRQRVRKLVQKGTPLSLPEGEDLAKLVVKAYDFRSVMVHQGSGHDDDLRVHFDICLLAVKLILKNRLRLSSS